MDKMGWFLKVEMVRDNPEDWNKGLLMVAMCVLARQCSRLFNVVTVNVVVSIIPNI